MYHCCSLKRFMKLLICDALLFSVLWVYLSANGCFQASGIETGGVELPIIMYHSVTNGTVNDYTVSPQQLESDLAYLRDNGYESVLPAELADYVNDVGRLPRKPIMLTFDDGFYNNYYYALPLLEEYGFSAVVSIVGSFTDVDAVKDPDVPEYSYLTWYDVNLLEESGIIEIGNHSYNLHSNINGNYGAARREGESEGSYTERLMSDLGHLQSEIAENTDAMPITFAYPYGYISPESVPVLKKLGFLVSLSCYERISVITHEPDCLFGLGRFNRSGKLTTLEFMKRAGI